ncbi:MAG TPA: hypothetical protein VLG92_00470 [Candidatus Saccharimonadia bacterium]|nr:hypothetical protein [Candidatus Saccharimonadia bacterium]
MDLRTGIRNLLAVLVGAGLMVLLIVVLFKAIFGHAAAPQKQVDVTKYADTNAAVTLLMDGPTNLDQNHYQVKITVDAMHSEIDVLQGYQGNVIKSQSYPSNVAAYGAFLQSLRLLGFAHGKATHLDNRGYCPNGSRYTYSFDGAGADQFSFWSTSCGGQGTFQGSPLGVRQLFESQIPGHDLTEFTASTGVNL